MFDSFAGSFVPGTTYAFRVSPAPRVWVQWDPTRYSATDHDDPGAACVPFASEGEDALLISAGYIATLVLLAPLGLLTLEENMLQQKFSFVALFVLTGEFLIAFCSTGLSSGSLPMVGNHWSDALGVVIFNLPSA